MPDHLTQLPGRVAVQRGVDHDRTDHVPSPAVQEGKLMSLSFVVPEAYDGTAHRRHLLHHTRGHQPQRTRSPRRCQARAPACPSTRSSKWRTGRSVRTLRGRCSTRSLGHSANDSAVLLPVRKKNRTGLSVNSLNNHSVHMHSECHICFAVAVLE
jgi:hypothetical protein